jgi:formylglycine-generating enzyme required for sulfatase activity
MSGNVWEWVSDWYGDYPAGSVTDPAGPSGGSYRVIRGGSWNDDPAYAPVANRGYFPPGGRKYYLGFRLARSNP